MSLPFYLYITADKNKIYEAKITPHPLLYIHEHDIRRHEHDIYTPEQGLYTVAAGIYTPEHSFYRVAAGICTPEGDIY